METEGLDTLLQRARSLSADKQRKVSAILGALVADAAGNLKGLLQQ